jgi:hypothetical protein
MIGCAYLYFSLPLVAILVLPGWGAVGLAIYFLYSRKRSLSPQNSQCHPRNRGRGIISMENSG